MPSDTEIALYAVGALLGVLVIAFVILAVCFCRWRNRLDEAAEEAAEEQRVEGATDTRIQGVDNYGADPVAREEDFYRYRMVAPTNNGVPAGADFRTLPTAYSNGYVPTSRVPSVDQRVVYSARDSSISGIQQVQPVIVQDEEALVRQGVLLPAQQRALEHGHDLDDPRAYGPRYHPPPRQEPPYHQGLQRTSVTDLQGFSHGGASMYAHGPVNPVSRAPDPSANNPTSPMYQRQVTGEQATRPMTRTSYAEPAQYRPPDGAQPSWADRQMPSRSSTQAIPVEPDQVSVAPSWMNHKLLDERAGQRF